MQQPQQQQQPPLPPQQQQQHQSQMGAQRPVLVNHPHYANYGYPPINYPIGQAGGPRASHPLSNSPMVPQQLIMRDHGPQMRPSQPQQQQSQMGAQRPVLVNPHFANYGYPPINYPMGQPTYDPRASHQLNNSPMVPQQLIMRDHGAQMPQVPSQQPPSSNQQPDQNKFTPTTSSNNYQQQQPQSQLNSATAPLNTGIGHLNNGQPVMVNQSKVPMPGRSPHGPFVVQAPYGAPYPPNAWIPMMSYGSSYPPGPVPMTGKVGVPPDQYSQSISIPHHPAGPPVYGQAGLKPVPVTPQSDTFISPSVNAPKQNLKKKLSKAIPIIDPKTLKPIVVQPDAEIKSVALDTEDSIRNSVSIIEDKDTDPNSKDPSAKVTKTSPDSSNKVEVKLGEKISQIESVVQKLSLEDDVKTDSMISEVPDKDVKEKTEVSKAVTSSSSDLEKGDSTIFGKKSPILDSTNNQILKESSPNDPPTPEKNKENSKIESNPKETKPSLPYEPNQYSPTNLRGRKKYSMEFLMAVLKKMKPAFDKMNIFPNRIDHMSPNYMAQSSPYRNMGSMKNYQPMQQIVKPRKTITIVQPDVELKTAENPWKPELGTDRTDAPSGDVTTEDLDTKKLIKTFRGHLNKLTPQKYDDLILKIGILDLGSDQRLNKVISLVFDKAVDEPSFCELYAKMCGVIAEKNKSFCYHLVKKCQEEFEMTDIYQDLNIPQREDDIRNELDLVKKKLLAEELYEDMRIRRKKYLGTIKLIGEMYKLSLLSPMIIGLCMNHLIQAPSNESIECLCGLMTTVGLKFSQENEDARNAFSNNLLVLQDMIHKKKNEFNFDKRIKFIIQDVIELSKKNWKKRPTENNPKMLDEIHREVVQERQMQGSLSMHQKNIHLGKLDERDRGVKKNSSFNSMNSKKW